MKWGLFLVGAGALALGAAAASCSSSSSPAAPAADAGADAPPATLTYSPAGCAYTVTPPAVRGFVDLALDDGAPITDAAGAAPLRVRAGLGGGTTAGAPGYADPTTSAALTWQTAAKVRAAKVKLGTAPGALSDVHTGYSWTTPAPTFGLGSNEPETYMHEVHVCGLTPGTTYYYQVGGGAPGQEAWSATQSFTTVPSTGKITVGVLGDARDNLDTWRLAQTRMRDAAVALQLVSGDIVDVGAIESSWDKHLDAMWHDAADPTKFVTLGQQLVLPVAGNHEADHPRFYANFALPGDGDHAEEYASFDVGSAHVVLVDDTYLAEDTTSPASKALLAWLDADLAKADQDRAAHPFVVVVSHRGNFDTSNHSHENDVLDVRGAVAPIYDKNHVDLVMNGHDHEYERSKPVHAGVDPRGDPVVVAAGQGTVYVVNAGAGADPYDVGAASAYRETATQLGGSYVGCYGLMALDGKTLTFTAYGLKASGADDVIDTLVLTK